MHGSTFLLELGGVALLLAVLARLSDRIGLSPIPLYLLGGLAFGAEGPLPIVTTRDFIESGATIGLALLLFTLGLEYAPQDLVRTLRSGSAAGALDLVLNAAPGLAAGWLLGWPPLAWLLLGGATYVSSSGVVARLLDELGWLGNREAPLVLGLLVVEDLVMALFLPLLAIGLAGGTIAEVAARAAAGAAFVGGALALGWRYGDRVGRVLVGRSEEGSLLALVGMMLLVAGAAEAFNVSAAVGAFLAGIVVAGPAVTVARGLIRPLRHLFSGAFFLFFGLQLDVRAIAELIPPALGLAAAGVGSKYLTGWWSARRVGLGWRARRRTALLLVPRGEFSIVLAGLGTAAGIEPQLGPLVGAYVLVLAILGPALLRPWARAGASSGSPAGP